MKALFSTIILATMLSSTGRVAALQSQVVYSVLIPDGPDLGDAADLGVMMFDLDADTGESCRYYMEWSNNMDPLPLSVECYVAERKPHAAASCVTNGRSAVSTMVTNDRRLPCFGWDTNVQAQPVFLLVAGESAATGLLSGVIQFSAAATFVYSFHAELYV